MNLCLIGAWHLRRSKWIREASALLVQPKHWQRLSETRQYLQGPQSLSISPFLIITGPVPCPRLLSLKFDTSLLVAEQIVRHNEL
jgi:hypothetical protein